MLGLVYFILLVLVISAMFFLSVLVNTKLKQDREKYSVFECGFDLLSALRLPFSLNFFFVTIIFLIFDVELTLILPFVFNMKFLAAGLTGSILVLFFIVLIVGFIYEWMVGLLNWLV